MSLPLFIVLVNGGLWFDILYLLAFFFSFLWLFWEGYKRRFNITAWAVAVAVTWFLFIVGTKLFTYSFEEWEGLLMRQDLPYTSNKILLGGLFLAMIGFPVIRGLLYFKVNALDALALALPLSIAIQRIGCFLAGCCHGNVTTLPWGAQYEPGTLPHYHQFTAGDIAPGDFYSLPVHPTQLYETAACLLVVMALLYVKKYIKAPGNMFLGAILLYSCLRFFVEFSRYDAAYAAATMVAGLKDVQWVLLVLLCVLGVLFFYREHTFTAEREQQQPAPTVTYATVLTLGLIFVSWGLRNWFTYTELLAVNMALVPAIAFVSAAVFRAYTVMQYRWLTLGALVLPLLLMSQTLIFKRSYTEDSTVVRRFNTLKLGYGSGDYQNSHTIESGSGCSGVSNTGYFQQEYKVGGAGFSVTTQHEKHEFTYGANAYAGKHHETKLENGVATNQINSSALWGVNPYVRYDRIWLGIGAGMHAGDLVYTLENLQEDGTGTPMSASKRTAVYPQLYARVGPTQLFFTDIELAHHFPSPFPGYRYRFGFGSGFGLSNGSFLKYSYNGADNMLSGQFVLGQKFVLEPLYLWKGADSYFSDRQRQASLGMHYRFNYR
ncbi:prolipoprotein diacylglyceryl transferase family protein [Pontibacter pamirensis]|uniref:prolipoprotein diacylglyceryl transferase family protein n=1 Tax=Pontibacter pamirensis TaxID=2562824 RepID=UPI0013896B28|nr:prolipoprotein diacylglyceryl transferase family protein [Pontibacter pamirensis]